MKHTTFLSISLFIALLLTPVRNAIVQETPTPSSSDLRIVFLANIGADNSQAYSVNFDGSDVRGITNTLGDLQVRNAGSVACSPDGRFVIFEANALYKSNVDGSNLTLITGEGLLTSVALSPTGTKVAFTGYLFQSDDSMGEIYTINIDGTGLARITNNTYVDSTPTWSPDEQKLAFHYDEIGGNNGIAIMAADGSNVVRLTSVSQGTGYDDDPSWSPDGQWIAFVRSRENKSNIYRIRPDGSDLTALTNDSHENFYINPRWSPDGSLISFSFKQPEDDYKIYVMKSDGTEVRQVTNYNYNADYQNACWLVPVIDNSETGNHG